MIGEYICNYLLRMGSFVGGPVAGLKGAMNIRELGSIFLVRYVVCRLALSPAFVKSMLMDIM